MTTPTDTRSLLDAIAALLPPEQREYFYRRMAHFENLHPDDEMLRIFEAMGFLTFILRDAPAEMTIEREKLAQLLSAHMTNVQGATKATAAYHQQLEARLTQLPEQIAKGINPAAIAACVGESLRQQLQDTGIQDTANELRTASSQTSAAVTGMQRTLAEVSDPRTGVFPRVDKALSTIQANLSQTADLSSKLYRQARPGLPRGVVAALLVVVLGLLYRWPSPSLQAGAAPVVSQFPPKTAQLVAIIRQQEQQVQNLQQRLQDTEAQLAKAQAAAYPFRRRQPLR